MSNPKYKQNVKLLDIKNKGENGEVLTLRQMGEKCGLHFQHVARLIYGYQKPNRRTAMKLIEAWPELTFDDLMRD